MAAEIPGGWPATRKLTHYLIPDFALTSNFLWANLTLFAIPGFLLGARMKRNFGRPQFARGKSAGSTLAALTLLTVILFGCLKLSFAQLPLSTGAPYAGQKAPDFTLPDRDGKPVSLSGLLKRKEAGKLGGLVLIFYRGYW